MSRLALTRHAVQRLRQRGFFEADADLIMTFGSEVEDGFLIRQKDRDEAVRTLKAILSRLERLSGARIVCRDGSLLTAYHATPEQAQRLLRPRRKRPRGPAFGKPAES